jgi:NifU-like protein involved in Fe-S cluster formation
MSFEGYNSTTMDHFLNPRNTGEVPGATHSAIFRNPVCGDTVLLTARVEGGVICEVRTKTFGCAAAIAASSALTEILKGRSLEEVRRVRNADIVARLNGLPEGKFQCSIMAEELINGAFPQPVGPA